MQPQQKGWLSKAKRSLKVWKQQQHKTRFEFRFYGKVTASKNNNIPIVNFNFIESNSQVQTTFTMESLILAQDER